MLPTFCPPMIWAIFLELRGGGRRLLRSMLQKSYDPQEAMDSTFPQFWPFLGSLRLTIKGVRGAFAIKGVFDK